MDLINNSNYSIILGSGSTRRRELLEMTGISFQINSIPVNEDFPEYLKAQEEVDRKYLDTDSWTKSSILSTAGSGFFSSDRTIKEYAEDIWGVSSCPVQE